MLFNSLEFLAFFCIVYPLYLILKHRWQNKFLIAASCVFYAAWSWKFLLLMFISISTDYVCARQIEKNADVNRRRVFLLLSIAVNLGILAFFKYFNFFAQNILVLFKTFGFTGNTAFNSLNIILPVGVSFYTFEAISYVTDVYRRQIKAVRKYWDYVLFIVYFPHLIAGPIMRAKNFIPQIVKPRPITWGNFYRGAHLFFWGLFEKMFAADNLAKIANPVFASDKLYDGAGVLVALYAFAYEIFCDFDGYSNMARGLGLCMGFDITVNFNLPYFSSNPREFWRRWHISLSSWLRDYVYIPLGGSRRGRAMTCINLMLTMLIGGLWHGAAWHFILWGGYQGLLLALYHLTARSKGEALSSRISWKTVVFFHLVVWGWLLFRAASTAQVLAMTRTLLFGFKITGDDVLQFIYLMMVLLPLLAVQYFQYKSRDLMFLFNRHWVVKAFAYTLMFYLLIGYGVFTMEQFIYFQF